MVLLRARLAVPAPLLIGLVGLLLASGVLAKLADDRASRDRFAHALSTTMDAEAAGIRRAASMRASSPSC